MPLSIETYPPAQSKGAAPRGPSPPYHGPSAGRLGPRRRSPGALVTGAVVTIVCARVGCGPVRGAPTLRRSRMVHVSGRVLLPLPP